MRRVAGVTLLESVIAIVIIAAVAGASLELRSRSMHARLAAAQAAETAGVLDALLRKATGGLMGEAQLTSADDDGRVRRVWTGEQGGDPFEVIVEDIEQANPLAARGDDESSIALRRYTARFRGQRAEEVRVRP